MTITKEIRRGQEEYAAESATGCYRTGRHLGQFFDHRNNPITRRLGFLEFAAGNPVSVPNAGAGSYREVFKRLGCSQVEVYEQSSSAGDWSFAVRFHRKWYMASQNNNYPQGAGFSYGMNLNMPFDSFDQLVDIMANY